MLLIIRTSRAVAITGMVLFSGCRAGMDREALLRFYQEYGSTGEGGGGVVQSDPTQPVSPRRSIPEIPPAPVVPPPVAAPLPVPVSPPPPVVVPEPIPAPIVPAPPVIPAPPVLGPPFQKGGVKGPVGALPPMPVQVPIQGIPPILGKDGMPIPTQKFAGPPGPLGPVLPVFPPGPIGPPVPVPPPLISSGGGASRPREERENRRENHVSPTVPRVASIAEGMGESCRSRDSFYTETLCLGVDYVTYREELEQDKEIENQILLQIEEVNRIWKVCEIQFQVDHHIPVDPAELQLNHRIAEFMELSEIRKLFATDSELLVVLTGKWDRSGSLGVQLANAWTTLPGDGLYGVIMERPMGMQPHLLAHELGHYLGLTHTDHGSELMYPIIYPNSITLTPDQCVSVRAAIQKHWQKMLR